MNTKITIALVLIFLSSVGSVALAQSPNPPPNVSGIQATYNDGTLTVSWNAVSDAASYRVYFSRVSILQNGGDYDDFEQTTGSEATYTFAKPPYTGQTLYFSVLAVNAASTESEAFVEETSVHVPVTMSSATSSTESSASSIVPSETPPALPLFLTQAVSTSSTGVTLVFSQLLNEQSVMLPAEIVLVDGSGARLNVQAGVIQGNTVMLTTDPQTNGRTYAVISISGSLQSAAGMVYQPSPQPVMFMGQNTQPVMPEQPRDTTPPEDVPTIQISPVKAKDGTYDIQVSWTPSLNSGRDLTEYLVSISRDGVISSPVTSMSADVTSVSYSKITPGPFGIRVQTKDRAGNISQGSIQVIQLPASPLPHTGVGLLGVALVSGALAGRRLMKKKLIA